MARGLWPSNVKADENIRTNRDRLSGKVGPPLVRILVVDDNPAVRHYLRAILEQQNSWQICGEARTGEEALQRAQDSAPDVILLDFLMPDMNGLDIAREIHRSKPRLPMLMVSVYMSSQLAAAAKAVGISGACAKSDVGSIVEAVRTVLQEKTYFPKMIAEVMR